MKYNCFYKSKRCENSKYQFYRSNISRPYSTKYAYDITAIKKHFSSNWKLVFNETTKRDIMRCENI